MDKSLLLLKLDAFPFFFKNENHNFMKLVKAVAFLEFSPLPQVLNLSISATDSTSGERTDCAVASLYGHLREVCFLKTQLVDQFAQHRDNQREHETKRVERLFLQCIPTLLYGLSKGKFM